MLQGRQEVLFEAIITKGLNVRHGGRFWCQQGNGRAWTGEGVPEPGERPVDPALGPEEALVSHRRPEVEAWVTSLGRGQRP